MSQQCIKGELFFLPSFFLLAGSAFSFQSRRRRGKYRGRWNVLSKIWVTEKRGEKGTEEGGNEKRFVAGVRERAAIQTWKSLFLQPGKRRLGANNKKEEEELG